MQHTKISDLNTLGLNLGASKDEIKKAYRKLSLKHHPDKGGDDTVFKEISAAYNRLQKDKYQPDYSSFNDFNSYNDFYDNPFANPYFKYNITNQVFNVNVPINSAKDDVELILNLGPNKGNEKIIIKDGVQDNGQYTFEGLGPYSDVLQKNTDIIVNVNIIQSDKLRLKNDVDVLYYHDVDMFKMLFGGSDEIKIFNRKLKIKIPQNSPKILRLKNQGLNHHKTGLKGDLYVEFLPYIPALDTEKFNKIKEIYES